MFFSCQEEDMMLADTELLDDTEGLLVPLELVIAGQDVCGIEDLDSLSETTTTITFNGIDCDEVYKRYGKIEVTLTKGSDWSEKDAEIRIKYIDYLNERDVPRSEKKIASSIKMNGVEYITNLTGGTIAEFQSGTLTFMKRRYISDGLSVEYNNSNSPRIISTNAIRDYVNDGEDVSITTFGGANPDGFTQVQEWGTNSDGEKFWNVLEEPIKRKLCNKRWLIIDGRKVRHIEDKPTRTNIYGVDENGNPSNGCSVFGYLETWINESGAKQERVISYFDN